MKWLDSTKFMPVRGTHIFIWNVELQQQTMLLVSWGKETWDYLIGDGIRIPYWSYVEDGHKPIPLKDKK